MLEATQYMQELLGWIDRKIKKAQKLKKNVTWGKEIEEAALPCERMLRRQSCSRQRRGAPLLGGKDVEEEPRSVLA